MEDYASKQVEVLQNEITGRGNQRSQKLQPSEECMDVFVPEEKLSPKQNSLKLLKWFKERVESGKGSPSEMMMNASLFNRVYLPAASIDLKHSLSEKTNFDIDFASDIKEYMGS